jgi:hypothetical protein
MKRIVLIALMAIIAIAMVVFPAFACSRWRRYDLNHDGKVDIRDIIIVARAYGSYKGHPRYHPRLDFNHDKRINIFDIVTIARYFGSGK